MKEKIFPIVTKIPIVNLVTHIPQLIEVSIIYVALHADVDVIIIREDDHIQDYYYDTRYNGFIPLTTPGYEIQSWEDSSFIHEQTPEFMIYTGIDGYLYNKLSFIEEV